MTPYPLSLMCQDAIAQFFFFFLGGKRVPLNPIILSTHRREAEQGESPGSGHHELGREGSKSVTSCLYDLGGHIFLSA